LFLSSSKNNKPLLLDTHALAQKPSAKALPRAAFGKDPLENLEFLDGKRVFAESPLSGTWQSLCRGPGRPSAKKSSRHGVDTVGGFFIEGRPSAKKCSFLKKFFVEGFPGASAKNFLNFVKKNLFRGPHSPLIKKFSRFFQKNVCRELLLGPSAKDPSLPRALVIVLGKDTTTTKKLQ
jgi:hypothetical protein